MLVFGNRGLTFGATWGVQHVLEKKSHHTREKSEYTRSDDRLRTPFTQKALLFVRQMDYRIAIANSMLPDIIDKPVGTYFFRETYSNGRIFGHILLFFILSGLAEGYLYKTRRLTRLLAISIGIFTHLAFDRIWHAPRTLFWPILGLSFERKDVSALIPLILREPKPAPALGVDVPVLDARDINNWIPDIIRNWLTDLGNYVQELA